MRVCDIICELYQSYRNLFRIFTFINRCSDDIEFINREILELGHKAKKAVVMSSHAYKPRYVKREDSYRSGELPNVDDLFADSSYMGTEVFSTIIYETIVPIMKLNCIAFE